MKTKQYLELSAGSKALWTFWMLRVGGSSNSYSSIGAPLCVTCAGQTSTGCNGWQQLCKNAAISTANLKNEPVPELNFHGTDKCDLFQSHR